MSEKDVRARAEAERRLPEIAAFLRAMIAIPSESGREGVLVGRIAEEMRALGFDEVKIDGFGNVLGRVGSGPCVVAIDGHVDTVGVGDRSTWTCDPYAGDVLDGVIHGRGASDQEGGFAAAVYGAAIAKHLDLLDGVTLWVTGTVQEEDCDGLCWQYLLREKILAPDLVVITEPTNLAVHRGHRGRMEIEVRTQGRSAHGSAPERGVNAIYKMGPILREIEALNDALAAGADPFLGKGSVTVSDIRSTSPSLCAVADSCTLYLDRRLTAGETPERAIAEIEALASVRAAGATVRVPQYEAPTHTGLVYRVPKVYPTWVVAEETPAIQAAIAVATEVLGRAPTVGKWVFSTNGIATCGMFGVPTVGFGPANEIHAHTPDDQCPISDLAVAAAFYARIAADFARRTGPRS